MRDDTSAGKHAGRAEEPSPLAEAVTYPELVMRWRFVLTALGSLLAPPLVSAGDDEFLKPDRLPPAVVSRIREEFGEPVVAQKEVEGHRACYVVTTLGEDSIFAVYASPDGTAVARKRTFLMVDWADRLVWGALYLSVPVVAAGLITRTLVRAARGAPLSPPAGWLAAWVGPTAGAALVVFNLATVPRDKDVPVLVAGCALFGAVAASMVEVGVLALTAGRVDGVGRLRWGAAFVAMAVVAAALAIPLDMVRIERENRYYKNLTLRHSVE